MAIYNRQQTVPEYVKSMREEIQLVKSQQDIAYDNIVMYTTQTDNTWDVTFNVPAFADAMWRVTFTPDVPGRFYAELGLNYQVTFNTKNVFYWADHTDVTSDTSVSFIVSKIMSFDPQTIQMKFQVRSVSPGTITWSKIV